MVGSFFGVRRHSASGEPSSAVRVQAVQLGKMAFRRCATLFANPKVFFDVKIGGAPTSAYGCHPARVCNGGSGGDALPSHAS